MNKQDFNKFRQVWRMFLNNNPMSDEELSFVCEQSFISTEDALSVLHKVFGLWELSIEKMNKLNL